MADSQPTLNSLAAKITELSETFTRYLKDNNIQQPTFAADSPTSYSSLSPEIFVTRQLLADALSDLWYLSQGPSESIYNYVHSVRILVLSSNHLQTPLILTCIVHTRCCSTQYLEPFRLLVCRPPRRYRLVPRNCQARFSS